MGSQKLNLHLDANSSVSRIHLRHELEILGSGHIASRIQQLFEQFRIPAAVQFVGIQGKIGIDASGLGTECTGGFPVWWMWIKPGIRRWQLPERSNQLQPWRDVRRGENLRPHPLHRLLLKFPLDSDVGKLRGPRRQPDVHPQFHLQPPLQPEFRQKIEGLANSAGFRMMESPSTAPIPASNFSKRSTKPRSMAAAVMGRCSWNKRCSCKRGHANFRKHGKLEFSLKITGSAIDGHEPAT